MATTVLNVPDISCAHCERAITEALSPLPGVATVVVDIPARRVRVEHDPAVAGVDRLTSVLAAEDYPVASVESSSAASA